MPTSFRILLVEDDENLGFVVSDLLEMAGYSILWSKDGEVALKDFNSFVPHLCVVDVMLPKKDGYALVADMKQLQPAVPVVFLTARGMEDDRIRGFQSGADDYITKPFSNQEFLLRISAILQRCYTAAPEEVITTYTIGEYTFNYTNLLLSGPSKKNLTQKESDILLLLCRHMGETVTRELILESVWGQNDYFMGRSLDVFISRLRKYLKEDARIVIENIHGVGFRLRIA